jgi:hypothetical protein
MENYKPTNEQIQFAKNVYDSIIVTQVSNPTLLRQAFKALKGYDALTTIQAKNILYSYFTYEYKKIDTTETIAMKLEIDNDNQSHKEDFSQPINEDKVYKPRGRRKRNE